jgi:hypothetical protein
MGLEGFKPDHVRKAQLGRESGLLSIFGAAGARKKAENAPLRQAERNKERELADDLAQIEADRLKETQEAEALAKIEDEEREAPVDPENPQVPREND